MITATPQDVIEKARELLAHTDRKAADSLAISDGYLQEGQWLHLVVSPKAGGISTFDFMDAIEAVEMKLRQQFGDEILIVPKKP